LHFSFHFPLLN
jgi:hypothetical protein